MVAEFLTGNLPFVRISQLLLCGGILMKLNSFSKSFLLLRLQLGHLCLRGSPRSVLDESLVEVVSRQSPARDGDSPSIPISKGVLQVQIVSGRSG